MKADSSDWSAEQPRHILLARIRQNHSRRRQCPHRMQTEYLAFPLPTPSQFEGDSYMRHFFILALALALPACASVSKTGHQGAEWQPRGAVVAPVGPIRLVYRDDDSNEATLVGVARYRGVLGRNRLVIFSVENQRGDHACDGTLTQGGANYGKFSLSCFEGKLSGSGDYERKPGDPDGSFVARGQTSRGLQILMQTGRAAQDGRGS